MLHIAQITKIIYTYIIYKIKYVTLFVIFLEQSKPHFIYLYMFALVTLHL